MKKTLLFSLLMLGFVSAGFAQFTFYKVVGEDVSELQAGEEVTIPVDAEGVPAFNIMVKTDIKAVRAAYEYDRIAIALDGTDKLDELIARENAAKLWMNFYHEETAQRLDKEKEAKFFLFRTPEVRAVASHWAWRQGKFSQGDTDDWEVTFGILGSYIDDEEKYYESGEWKVRYSFSNHEILTKFKAPRIKWIFSDAFVTNGCFELLHGDSFGYWQGVTSMREMDYQLKKAVKEAKSFKVQKALEEIRTYVKSTLEGEKDKAKAVALAREITEGVRCSKTGKMDAVALKELNKALKVAADPRAKLAAFAKHNPRK